MADELLSEADGAFYAFAGVMLALYEVPAMLFTLYRGLRAAQQGGASGTALKPAITDVA
ncbi:Hypothetical protein PHPALM_2582, partial [Phytophthora palmivora]